MFNLQSMEVDGLLVARFAGVLDATGAGQVVDFVESKELAAGTEFNRFCDMTQLEGIHLSTNDILQLAARRRMFNPNVMRVKSAFFATEPLAFGISRMYEQMLNSPRIEVRVWGDTQTAAAWLGVTVDTLTL